MSAPVASRKANMTKVSKEVAFWGGVLVLMVTSYLWRYRILGVFPYDYDEGIHLILSKLSAAGYAPYKEIFVSYPPSFFWSLGVPWQLFSQASAVQMLMATYSLAGVVAVIYLGSLYHSRLAGVVAGALLSFSPAYFIPSVAVMGEVPSIGMAVASVALTEKYRRDGSWRTLLLAGAVLGFGLSLKILPFYAVPFIGLLTIARHFEGHTLTSLTAFRTRLQKSLPRLSRDVAILAGGFLIVFLLPLFLFDFAALYDQVFGMRLVSREAQVNPFDSNNGTIITFLFSNPGLTALAFYGLVFVAARNMGRYWLLLVWFVFVWVSMYFHIPLREKHLPIFLPILALFAGFAVQHMVSFILEARQKSLTPQTVAVGLAMVVAAGMFIWNVPQMIAQNNGQALEISENVEREIAIDFIDTIAAPNDCVIADNPVFLYNTDRLPPPELAETSQTRIDTGYLTLDDLITAIETDQCHVVAIVSPRFGESIPGLHDWLRAHYLGYFAQRETFVYYALKGADAGYDPAIAADFSDQVRLFDTAADPQIWRQNEAGYLSLYWELLKPIEGDYVERLMLTHSENPGQSYQMENNFLAGFYDRASWQPGELIKDTVRVELPPDLPAGTYQLNLSFCRADGTCLPVDQGQQTTLSLGQIDVAPEKR